MFNPFIHESSAETTQSSFNWSLILDNAGTIEQVLTSVAIFLAAYAAFRVPRKIHKQETKRQKAEFARQSKNYRNLCIVEFTRIGTALGVLKKKLENEIDELDESGAEKFKIPAHYSMHHGNLLESKSGIIGSWDTWPKYLNEIETKAILCAINEVQLVADFLDLYKKHSDWTIDREDATSMIKDLTVARKKVLNANTVLSYFVTYESPPEYELIAVKENFEKGDKDADSARDN